MISLRFARVLSIFSTSGTHDLFAIFGFEVNKALLLIFSSTDQLESFLCNWD